MDKVTPVTLVLRKRSWITKEIRGEQNKRGKRYRKFCFTKTKFHRENYQVYRKQVVSKIHRQRRKFYEQKRQQKMWRTLKDLIGSRKQYVNLNYFDFGKPVEEIGME